jgi:hypothetical protein
MGGQTLTCAICRSGFSGLVGARGGGRLGSVLSASGAGSLGVGSSEASGSGAGVAAAGFGLHLMSLADLIKQESVMLLHKSRKTGCLLCRKRCILTAKTSS